jgi:hypothetical protein
MFTVCSAQQSNESHSHCRIQSKPEPFVNILEKRLGVATATVIARSRAEDTPSLAKSIHQQCEGYLTPHIVDVEVPVIQQRSSGPATMRSPSSVSKGGLKGAAKHLS